MTLDEALEQLNAQIAALIQVREALLVVRGLSLSDVANAAILSSLHDEKTASVTAITAIDIAGAVKVAPVEVAPAGLI